LWAVWGEYAKAQENIALAIFSRARLEKAFVVLGVLGVGLGTQGSLRFSE
jgi:hypothetical protein